MCFRGGSWASENISPCSLCTGACKWDWWRARWTRGGLQVLLPAMGSSEQLPREQEALLQTVCHFSVGDRGTTSGEWGTCAHLSGLASPHLVSSTTLASCRLHHKFPGEVLPEAPCSWITTLQQFLSTAPGTMNNTPCVFRKEPRRLLTHHFTR